MKATKTYPTASSLFHPFYLPFLFFVFLATHFVLNGAGPLEVRDKKDFLEIEMPEGGNLNLDSLHLKAGDLLLQVKKGPPSALQNLRFSRGFTLTTSDFSMEGIEGVYDTLQFQISGKATFSSSGVEGSAKSFTFFPGEKKIQLMDGDIKISSVEGSLSSHQMSLSFTDGVLQAEGDVILNAKDFQLKSHSLRLMNAEKVLYAENFTFTLNHTAVFTGDSLKYLWATGDILVQGRLAANFSSPEAPSG